jgi:hypothetical protein
VHFVVTGSPGSTLLAHCRGRKAGINRLIGGKTTDRPLVTGSLISSVLAMFSTTCRIIVFACDLERAADLPMRSSARTIHLFDSGRLGQSQGLDADTAWQL